MLTNLFKFNRRVPQTIPGLGIAPTNFLLAQKERAEQFIIVDLSQGINYAGVLTHPISGLALVLPNLTAAEAYACSVAKLSSYRIVKV